MVILTPYYEAVIERLQTLFDSIAHFKCAEGYKMVLMATHKIPMSTQVEMRNCALNSGFDQVYAIDRECYQHWPEAINEAFYEGAKWIQEKLPEADCFLLLEHDCTIIGPSAFDILHDDWKFHGTPICGTCSFTPGVGMFTHGIAIYANGIIDLIGADNLTSCGDKPYDLYLREWILPMSSHTGALFQTQRVEKVNLDSCKALPEHALVHHPCKDGSLFKSILTHNWTGWPVRMRDAAPSGVSDDDDDGMTCLSRARCSLDSWNATVKQLKKMTGSSGPCDERP